MARYGNPGMSNAGARREASFRESRRTAERALLADVADYATEATTAFSVSTATPRATLDDTMQLALLADDDRIEPAPVLDFLAYLETKYVLTPIP